MVWQGKPLPCQVKAAVYEKELAAGIGIRGTNPGLLEKFLMDSDRFQLFRELLRKQIDAELASQKVTVGIDENEIREAIREFMDVVSSGSGEAVSRRVAAGQPPGEGMDGCFEYLFNTGGLPLKMLERKVQMREGRKVHRVKEGEVLVRHQPPEKGVSGQTVRGKTIPMEYEPRDVSLERIAGANTEVQGERLVAAIDGVYCEEMTGEVRVVQELEVDEVNATTGDLPAVGIGDVNVLVNKGIAGGAGVLTTENVFVGSREKPGIIEGGTRVRAQSLCVCGQLSGGQLPEAYVTGEVEALDPDEQEQIHSELEKGLVQVEKLFGARDVRGRNVRAETILVQSHVYNAALEAEGNMWIDGDLVGGMASCGGGLRVTGDLGNSAETPTRIQIGTEGREAQKAQRVKEQILEGKHNQAECVLALQEHMDSMQERGKQSEYWAALLKEEQRSPNKPFEKQLLNEFLKAKKRTRELENQVRDAQRYVWDLEELAENAEEESQTESGFQIVVGGTIYPGVRVELVRELTAEDLEKKVKNRTGMDTVIQFVRNRLSEQVEHHIELYRDSVEERRKAIEEMYRDRGEKPEMPEIPDKCFQEYVSFAAAGGKENHSGLEAVQEGVVFVHAHDPHSFFLRETTRINAPIGNATIRVEQEGGDFVLKCVANKEKTTPWQKDETVLQELGEVWVMGQSARTHLLGQAVREEGKK